MVDDDGKEHWIDGRQQIRHMNVSSYTHMEDMILLGDLNEAGILRNLFLRYKDNFIYVSRILSGSLIITNMLIKCALLNYSPIL